MMNVDFEAYEAASSAYDVPDDSPNDDIPSYEAYVAFIRGMKMNRKAWSSLTQEDKDAWDKITQKGKDIILRSRPLPRGARTTTPWNPHDDSPGITDRPPDRPFRPTLPSALRNQAANLTEQHSASIPPDPYPPTTREVKFCEQPDNVPTKRPPDSSHLRVHRAEAILRASTDDAPADGNCIFRLLSDPSRFPASSTNTSTGEEGKVRQEGTRSVTHKLLDRF